MRFYPIPSMLKVSIDAYFVKKLFFGVWRSKYEYPLLPLRLFDLTQNYI